MLKKNDNARNVSVKVSLMGITPYSALNFTFYHNFKKLTNYHMLPSTANFLAGGLSGMAAVTFTYPTDLIRNSCNYGDLSKCASLYRVFRLFYEFLNSESRVYIGGSCRVI